MVMNRGKEFVSLLKETFKEWQEDKASRLAAALAYYTIFSMAPLLLLTIALAGLVVDKSTVQGDVYTKLNHTLGKDSAQFVQDAIAAVDRSNSGTLATVIGLGTLIFGAAGVFNQLQSSLDTIWDVEPKPGRPLMELIRTRFLSFALIPTIGFLLLVSLVLEAGLSFAATRFADTFPNMGALVALRLGSSALSFLFITFLFALIFKVLPDVNIALRDVLLGAVVTAVLFTIGRFLIGLYLGYSSTASAYGAAGSLIVILLWIYYSAQIVFFGAEFTQVYSRRTSKQIEANENAIPLTAERRIEQGMPTGEQVQTAQLQAEGGRDSVHVRHIRRSAGRKRAVGTVATALLAFIFGAAAGLWGRRGEEKFAREE